MSLLLSRFSSNIWCACYGVPRAFRVLLYSTQTLISSSSKDTLYERILTAGEHRGSIVPVLDQWVEEGRTFNEYDLKIKIKLLRNYKRFSHALQLSEWLRNKRYLHLSSPGDVAVQLDLVSKVHGLEEAEKYFSNIPDGLRTYHVYSALLNCYAYVKSVQKAETIMQKMRELGFLKISLPYNVMMDLYAKMGKREKLDALFQEMEERGMVHDKATSYIRLNSFVTASDIEGMEKLLMKIESDPLFTLHWNTYVIAATGYLKAGRVEKTLEMLKKSEQLCVCDGKRRRFAYGILLTIYASLARKDEVYRLWYLLKKMGKVNNKGYFRMISSLVKLDDIDGAETIFEEWESQCSSFDFQIPNLLINVYSKKGLLEKAEAFVKRAVERGGKEPPAGTWDHLATGYYKDNQMAKAVENMKKAISANPCGWKLNRVTLKACLEFLEKNGHVEAIEEFTRLLGEHGHFSYLPGENDIKENSARLKYLNKFSKLLSR
ncbi:pentatricopeptide repeat-containing protein At2g20710, mitochondrial-like [Cornus florida]|uniref:pentatricopeptide repeat-containing protein At2g20710, mitochondrial-like n=1 Tax=Cornus florida TaxID=4283 RepID=UPI00289C5AB4|nr:pentatricopeptide repeat-containing protein At2g20710, mitochondrial-like [Cornus florida]